MNPQKDTNTQQSEIGQNGKTHNASRLTIAGVLALVGARLGVEVTIVFNFLKDLATGKYQKTASSEGNIPSKAVKMLFSSFNQKSTYIAAAIGATALGAFGWARGERIEHPLDLLKHPFNSFKALFGRQPQQKDTQATKADTLVPQQAEARQSINTAVNTTWQNKMGAEQQSVTSSGQGL